MKPFWNGCMEYVDRLALATNSYLQFELFEINSLDMNGNKLTKVIGPPFWNGSLYFANFRTYTIFLLSFTTFKVVCQGTLRTTTRKVGRNRKKRTLLVIVENKLQIEQLFKLDIKPKIYMKHYGFDY